MHTMITALVSLKNWLLIKDTFEKEKTAFKGESLNQSLPLQFHEATLREQKMPSRQPKVSNEYWAHVSSFCQKSQHHDNFHFIYLICICALSRVWCCCCFCRRLTVCYAARYVSTTSIQRSQYQAAHIHVSLSLSLFPSSNSEFPAPDLSVMSCCKRTRGKWDPSFLSTQMRQKIQQNIFSCMLTYPVNVSLHQMHSLNKLGLMY